MPVDRDKEGKVRVVPTEFTDTSENHPTVPIRRDKTEIKDTPLMDSPDKETPVFNPNDSIADNVSDSKKTKIIIGNPNAQDLIKDYQPDSDAHSKANFSDQPLKIDDFATAALVIIKGSGMGQIVTMGMGMNTVGRDSSQRVCLNFGDSAISREKHCRLIYDNRGKEYLIAVGDSANLVYLNGKRIVESQVLKYGDTLEIGETLLRFIPFCDDNFEWNK